VIGSILKTIANNVMTIHLSTCCQSGMISSQKMVEQSKVQSRAEIF